MNLCIDLSPRETFDSPGFPAKGLSLPHPHYLVAGNAENEELEWCSEPVVRLFGHSECESDSPFTSLHLVWTIFLIFNVEFSVIFFLFEIQTFLNHWMVFVTTRNVVFLNHDTEWTSDVALSLYTLIHDFPDSYPLALDDDFALSMHTLIHKFTEMTILLCQHTLLFTIFLF